MSKYLDRGDAVNLARCIVEDQDGVSRKGANTLAVAVLNMDTELCRLYEELEKPRPEAGQRNAEFCDQCGQNWDAEDKLSKALEELRLRPQPSPSEKP